MYAIENDPSSRMQVRGRGQLQPPASCYVCGNGSHDGGYIDFGTFVDYHGNFYLCMTCAEQLATTIGWVHPEMVEQITKNAATTAEELAVTQKELADARQHIDSLNVVLSNSFAGGSPSVPNGTAVPQSEGSNGNDLNPFAGSGSGESESEKPVKGAKRAGVTGDAARDFTE